MKIPPAKKAPLLMLSDTLDPRLSQYADVLSPMGRVESVDTASEAPQGALQTVVDGVTYAIPLDGLIDLDAERKRLGKEIEKAQMEIEKSQLHRRDRETARGIGRAGLVGLTEFDIRHPELNGFEAYYDKEVLPFLEENEGSRLEAIRKSKIGVAIIAVIAIAVAFFSFQKYQVIQALIFPAFGSVAASVGLFHFLTHKIGAATKEKIVGAICAYVKWSFVAKVIEKPDISAWQAIGLLPKGGILKGSRRTSFEDHIFGEVHGADFESRSEVFSVEKSRRYETCGSGRPCF